MAQDEPIVASVAGRYAAALFDLAKDSGQLEAVEWDIETFAALMDESADFRRFVRSPVFSAEDQVRAVTAVMDQTGIGPLGANFFKLVARNRRLFVADDMIHQFRVLAARHRGEVSAEVTSAHPLTPEQAAALEAQLGETTGKRVKLMAKVDPNLLGGLIVKLGTRMIDSSLRTKLQSLEAALGGTAA